MTFLDFSIIALYLLALVGLGLRLTRRASTGIESYFLGGRSMPWWMLGASGMASNLDVSGTMIIVAMIYALGVQGFFIEIRGGIVLVMAFLLVFTGKWSRRSGAMTNAEWMQFRFGPGRPGDLARLMSAVSEVIFATAIVSYFATGAGKFFGEFLGISESLAATAMIVIALSYTVTSGLYGVVVTDLLQGALIGVAILAVAGFALAQQGLPETFAVSVPMADGSFQSLATSREAWTNILPSWTAHFPGEYSIYNLFGISIFFYLLRTTIEGTSGSGGYMMQRFYAARSERDVGLLSLFWIFLLSFRWAFVAAVAVLGILYAQATGEVLDPERVLPTVINVYFPSGVKGLLVAALLAAGMSTFDSVVNGGSAYWVRDIYQKFLRPAATERQLIRMSRLASLAIVVAGLLASTTIRNINDIWGWLTMSIGAGMLVPLFLRWYWERFNGYGFAAGMFAGMAGAILQRTFFGEMTEYAAFASVGGLALVSAILTTLLTAPVDPQVLQRFYRKTRPFGLWRRCRSELAANEVASITREHRRDAASTAVAVGWQLTLFLTMMFAVLKEWETLCLLAGLLALFSVLLYRIWYRHLPREGADGA